jgi:hypothetical protein
MKHYLLNTIEYDGQLVTDISSRYKFLDKFRENVKFYFDYVLEDGENPEMVSYGAYETTSFWWVILLFNEITDPFFGWLLTFTQLEKWAKKITTETYGTREDFILYGGSGVVWDGHYYDKRDELETENDEKRVIKVLKNEYLGIVIEQIKKGL